MGKSRRRRGSDGGSGEPQEPQEPQEQTITDEQWQQVHTAEEIAELTGWEFTKTKSGSYEFYDKEHDMLLVIKNTMLSNHFINAKSDGKSVSSKYSDAQSQNLNDIARMVYELPEANKNATPAIIFRNNYKTGILGQHMALGDFWGDEVPGHAVIINSSSFNKYHVGHSIRRTLLHETNHSADYMRGTGGAPVKSREHNGISSKQSFRDAINADVKNNGIKGISANSGQYDYGSNTYFSECWADSASIVQLKQMGYTNEKVQLYNGDVITVNEWVDRHPNAYKETVKELDTHYSTSFEKDASYNVLSHHIVDKYKLHS